MDERPANVVESLVRDGVAGQRASGVIPRPNDVHKYVAGIVERMERRDADARLRIQPKPAPAAPPSAQRSSEDMESEYQKRCRRHGIEPLAGSWTTTRKPAAGPDLSVVRLKNLRRSAAGRRMVARLRLLRSKPEWRARVEAICAASLLGHRGEDEKRRTEHLLRELITASDAVFGPWMKAPPKRLFFT